MAYSPQVKLNTVNLYLTSEKSYQEVANEVGINNPSLISQWVTHYRDKGEFAFSDSRGRPRKESNLPLENKKTSELSDTEQKISKLQKENLRLRIENKYLKGLRRLRLEPQAKENPDLFKTSTDDSSSPSK